MLNIHFLSKYPPELITYYMKQSPIQYYSLTKSEAKLFQFINQFHSNGCLGKRHQLNYSRKDLAYITPYLSFLHFYQLISSNSELMKNHQFYFSSKYKQPIIGNCRFSFKRLDLLSKTKLFSVLNHRHLVSILRLVSKKRKRNICHD